jgi:hypothetical protein
MFCSDLKEALYLVVKKLIFLELINSNTAKTNGPEFL